MEDTIDSPPSSRILYKDRAIWGGTFLGGPLAAGYFIAENFKALDDPDKARKTWVITIAATVAIFALVFLIPGTEKLPGPVIPLVYTGLAFYLVQHFQGEKIKAHVAAGGKVHSGGRVLGVGLAGLVLTVVPVIAYVYLSDPVFTAQVKKYGNLGHEIYYKKSDLSEQEVDALASALSAVGFFDETQQKSVYAKKENAAFVIMIPLVDNAWNDPEAVKYFEQFRSEVQNHFSGGKIIIDLCEDISSVKKRIE
jgi:hypothetical protein